MKNIQILLSTYNGEKYLKAQLDSFVRLENFESIKILIRDDGSKDGTLAILDEYSEKYGFEIIKGENIGLNASMHELIKARDKSCKYFSFSDQDDVWLPSKVKRGIDALANYDNEPVLYAACSTLVDVELNPFGHLKIPKRPLSFYNAMIENVTAGHTQICNEKMMNIIASTYSEDVVIFDHFIYLISAAAGKVIYDEECTTLYRQHGNNVVGYRSSFFGRLKIQIRAILKADVCKKSTKQLDGFVRRCENASAPEYLKEAKRFLKAQRNFFTRLGYVFTSKFYRQSKLETPITNLMYLLGMYKIKTKRSTHK